jgi:hypothetical protein
LGTGVNGIAAGGEVTVSYPSDPLLDALLPNGVQVTVYPNRFIFSDYPGTDIIALLKSHRYWWNKTQGYWYKKQHNSASDNTLIQSLKNFS